MKKLNVLVISYGSREAALADALYRSNLGFSLYFADKQRNPFNVELSQLTGGSHVVIPDLDIDKIYQCAESIHSSKGGLRFVLVGPEAPIIKGIADRIEDGLKIPVIAPRKKYAIEGSKAEQRKLIEKVFPEANPAYAIFGSAVYHKDPSRLLNAAFNFMDELSDNIVIKPDEPIAGKGVVVSGDHFQTPEEAHKLFSEMIKLGDVVIEEKLDGEESSFIAFCDGNKIIPVRDTRDYKRAFDGDKGPNTGGMGSYMDKRNWLPFMMPYERAAEEKIMQRIFEHMRGPEYNPHIKGVPYYVAFMHTKNGPKILEINSRPGDPEIMNILLALETDFGEICLRIIEGNLEDIEMKPLASVVMYLVPPTYGGKEPDWKGSRKVNYERAKKLAEENSSLRVYPGSMELPESSFAYRETYMLKSRALALVGLGETIEEARNLPLKAADSVEGESWRRTDIASKEHIRQSIEHRERLRAGK